jgi:sugar lactone lactonase YvrE
VAGTGTAGYIGEGVATEVRFNEPNGVAVDGAGNIFIADINNHRVRKVTAGTITTVAGRGYLLGTSRIYVSLSSPRGVTVKGDKIYVTDTGRHSIYVLDKNTGFLSITYGNGKAGLEIVGEGMIFNQPYRVAVESTGNIIVADNTNNRIRRVLLNGANSTIIAGGGADTDTSSGPPTSKRLNRPNGVAVFGSILYFTNTGANTVCKVQGGNISNLPGSYSAPEGIAVDSVGNVYVANTGLNQISIVATDNSVTNITFSDGTIPRGVAVDGSGSIYIADGGMNRILRLKTDSSSGLVSNIIMATELNNPMDVSVDTDGTLYVADYGNNKIMKIVTTFV